MSVDDKVLCSTGGSLPLARQNTKVIAMVGARSVRSHGIPLGLCARDKRANRAFVRRFSRWPIETVMLSCRADDLLRIFRLFPAATCRRSIVSLCVYICAAEVDHIKFIAPNAAIENFLLTLLGIEIPATAVFYQRYRKRPIFHSHAEHRLVYPIVLESVRHVVSGGEPISCRLIGDGIAGLDQLRSVGT